MRLLFFSHIFPRPGKPNLGIFSLQQCVALVDAGHSVQVVSPRPWIEGLQRRLWHPSSTPLGWEKISVDYPLYVYPPGILRSLYGQCMWASSRSSLRKAIAQFKPDCIVSYWAHPDGHVAAMAAREAGLPAAVIIGGSDVLILPHESRLRRRAILAALRSVDAVVTVSQHLKDETIALGIPAECVHVVYQGADRTRFTPGDRSAARVRLGLPTEERILLFVGSLLPVKGVDVLLEACARLVAEGIQFHLYLVGEGSSRGGLVGQAHKLRLEKRVTFVGAVRQHLLPDWYRAADLKVLASRSEGIPNVLREAMACGVPFVASRVGGIHEIADDKIDRLVPPEDPKALAEAIASSLRMPQPVERAPRGDTWADSAASLVEVIKPFVRRRFSGESSFTNVEPAL